MADPTAVRAALIAKLQATPAIVAAFPDADAPGTASIWFGVAPPGLTKFIIVSLVIGEDEDVFGETDAGIQTYLYLVKAVEKTKDSTNVDAGAVLIHTALQKQPLTITGYSHMVTKRVEPVAYPEVDDDTDEQWQHSGGRYEVMVSSNG